MSSNVDVEEAAPTPFVVHEWGTFTAVAGDDGRPIEWEPLDGPSDLPAFVYDAKHPGLRGIYASKGETRIRMETPVLYFHSDIDRNVSVRVDFPRGQVTEWYPRAAEVGQVGQPGFVDWGRFLVTPTHVKLADDHSRSHYYPARAVDAADVQVCATEGTEHERFLFYRGVGDFDLSLHVALDGKNLQIDGPDGEVIVFDSLGGKVGFTAIDLDDHAAVPRPGRDDSAEDVGKAVEALLVARGLYADEAHAMLTTWQGTWFEDGLRVLYVLPRTETDAILPLTISPAPDQIERVLVGRIEVVTPEIMAEVRATVELAPTPEKAVQTLRATHGRFAEPALRRAVADEADAARRARLQAVLTDLQG